MSPSSATKSKKTLICQSKQHYIPKGLYLQQHRCQNQKFCRDFINRRKRCDVYISSGIVRILIMETRWVEHVAWMQKRKEVGIWYLIYLLTAIGLPPGGSSTAHIYTQTIHRTTQNKQYIEQHKNFGRVWAMPQVQSSSYRILGRKHLKDATWKMRRYKWLTMWRLSGKSLRKPEMGGKRS
jgi:hypothetical protein